MNHHTQIYGCIDFHEGVLIWVSTDNCSCGCTDIMFDQVGALIWVALVLMLAHCYR